MGGTLAAVTITTPISIPDEERRVRYTPGSPTSDFSVTFPIFSSGDLDVYLNGTATHDYTVTATLTPSGLSGIGYYANGVVHLNTPFTGTIDIVGARSPRRITSEQFADGRGVSAAEFNLAFNRHDAEARELYDRQQRSLVYNLLDITGDPTLPLYSAGKFLTWSTLGTAVANSSFTETSLLGWIAALQTEDSNLWTSIAEETAERLLGDQVLDDRMTLLEVGAGIEEIFVRGAIAADGSYTAYAIDDSVGEKEVDGGVVVELDGDDSLADQTTAYAGPAAYGTATPLTAPVVWRRVGDRDGVDPAWWWGGKNLQAAVKYAAAAGRKVNIKDVYETAESIFLYENSYLEFLGDGEVRTALDFTPGVNNRALLVGIGMDLITIVNPVLSDPAFAADATKGADLGLIFLNTGSDLTIRGGTLSGAANLAVSLSDCERVFLDGVEIAGAQGRGLVADLTNSLRITGCNIHDNGIDGGNLGGEGIRILGTNGLFIYDNLVHDNGDLAYDPFPGDGNDPQSAGMGMQIGASDDTVSQHVIVTGNKVFNNARDGISLFGVKEATVCENAVHWNGDCGIAFQATDDHQVSKCIAANNRVFENRESGILVAASEDDVAQFISNVTITGNICEDNGYNFSSGLASRFDSDTPAGVLIIVSNGASNTGIVRNVAVTGNILRGSGRTNANQRYGVHLAADWGGASGTIQGVTIKDNIIEGNVTAPLHISGTVVNVLASGNSDGSGASLRVLGTTATPSVILFDRYSVAASGTAVTNFTDGFEGQELDLFFLGARTITHNSNIVLSGAVNFVGALGNTLRLRKAPDGKWYESGRST